MSGADATLELAHRIGELPSKKKANEAIAQSGVKGTVRPFRILVPISNTPVSVYGFMYALGLAKKTNGVIHVLHCLQQFPNDTDPELSFLDKVQKVDQLKYGRRCWEELQDGRALLERCKKKLKKNGIPFSLELASFISVRECIVSIAYRSFSNVIVIGTADRSKLDRVFQHTSLTKSVIETTDLPVIAVRYLGEIPKAIPELPTPFRIMVAYNDSAASISALFQAVELARLLDGVVSLVYVYNPRAENAKPFDVVLESGLKILSHQSVRYLCSHIDLPEDETVAGHLCTFGSNFDLIVLGSRSRSAKHAVFRSELFSTVRKSPVPVMGVRIEEESQRWTEMWAQIKSFDFA